MVTMLGVFAGRLAAEAVSLGMTEAQITSIKGAPKNKLTAGKKSILKWADIEVIFQNGTATKITPDSPAVSATPGSSVIDDNLSAPLPSSAGFSTEETGTDPSALYNLRLKYFSGIGAVEDGPRAARCFRAAAELGHARAQMMLGLLYGKGQGVAANDTEAMKWFQKSAEQGLEAAQLMLANIYYRGGLAPKNINEAIKWAERAAKQGNAEAKIILDAALHSPGAGISAVNAGKTISASLADSDESRNIKATVTKIMKGDEEPMGVWKKYSDGYSWAQASDDQKMALCENLARVSRSGNSAAYFYQALNSFYSDSKTKSQQLNDMSL